ncbi:MAG: TlpA family protein disulfide reductase, partial [Chitinophagaceae bacterium]|nr:TlpA family protein disulfide reductase [Chitinophagaceae bacterium]
KPRFAASALKPTHNLSGRWAVTFIRPNGTDRPAVAEFTQKGASVVGTVLTPSGDYRYLEGSIKDDSLLISVFDGSHSYLLVARIASNNNLADGIFYAGANGREGWKAVRNSTAELPDVGVTPQLKPGEERLDFQFRDLDRNMVGLSDERFQNKVVVIQLMGSWCPNCMDETRFLNNYYKANKKRGVEMIGLAYEYSTDYERSRRSLSKFRDQFNVEYPLLITPVWLNDTLRTEKTLPQITPIKVFPTTIFIGKDGKVKKIETGFVGPGTGIHHEKYKKEFEKFMEGLIRE